MFCIFASDKRPKFELPDEGLLGVGAALLLGARCRGRPRWPLPPRPCASVLRLYTAAWWSPPPAVCGRRRLEGRTEVPGQAFLTRTNRKTVAPSRAETPRLDCGSLRILRWGEEGMGVVSGEEVLGGLFREGL